MGETFSFGKFLFGGRRKRHGKVEQANFDFWSPETDSGDEMEEERNIGGHLEKILFLLVPMVILLAVFL